MRWAVLLSICGLLAVLLMCSSPQPAQAVRTAPGGADWQMPYVFSQTLFLPFLDAFNPSIFDIHNQESVRYFYNHAYAVAAVAAGWTGSVSACTPGDTTAEFKASVLQRINFYRQMAGVPLLSAFNDTYNQRAQAAALMMSANASLNHNPPLDWKCYSNDGKLGAGSSNLALGAYGPGAIDLYMSDDGVGNTPLGHRRWLLYPPTLEMGSGDIPYGAGGSASNSLYVFDYPHWSARPPTRDEFVAWPPAGFVPYTLVSARWSFSYPGANFTTAVVSVSASAGSRAVTPFTPVNGYGDNSLTWQVAGSFAPDTFSVDIQGVMINNAARDFHYQVITFDPAK